jgi:hypothetical protein
MANLTAGFTDDSALGAVERAGQSYNVDGANVSDPVTGTVFGSINFEAVEQVDVNMFGAMAEYGAFTGASLNMVTKSGGNEFSGEVNYFAQRVDWVSDNTTNYEQLSQPTAADINDYNFVLGGPIMRDKIWFLANYKHENSITKRGTLDGPIDQEETPRQTYGKVTARWDDRNLTTAAWTRFERGRSHRVAYGSWATNHEDGLWQQVTESDNYLMTHSFVLTDDIIIEGKLVRFFGNFDLWPRVEGPTLYNYDTREYDHSLSRTDLYERNRDDFLATVSYYNDDLNGTHSFKIGFNFEDSYGFRFYSHKLRQYIRNGDWYRWLDYGEYEGGTVIQRYAAFIQDSWAVNDNLTLNLGFRWDRTQLRADRADHGGLANGQDPFLTFNDPALRLGFAYDLFGDGKTVLKGFYGRYYEAVVNGNTEPMITNTPQTLDYRWDGSEWILYYASGGSQPGQYEIDPDIANQYTEGFTVSVDRELTPVIGASASFIYKWDDNILGAVYPNETWDEVQVDDQYYTGVIYDNLSEGSPEYYTNPTTDDKGVLIEPQRKYWALRLELKKRMSDNYSFRASYVYSRSTGIASNGSYGVIQGFNTWSDPNSYINDDNDARQPRDIPHDLKLMVTWNAPLDLLVSPILTYRSGRPYVPFVELGNDNITIPIYRNDGKDRYDNQLNLDLRIDKYFVFKDRYRIGVVFDIFNVFNDDAATGHVTHAITSSRYEEVSSIVGPRFYQVGVRLLF